MPPQVNCFCKNLNSFLLTLNLKIFVTYINNNTWLPLPEIVLNLVDGISAPLQEQRYQGDAQASLLLRLCDHGLDIGDELGDTPTPKVVVAIAVIHHEEVGVVRVERHRLLRLDLHVGVVLDLVELTGLVVD